MKGAGTGIITSFYKEVAEINEFHWQEEKVFFFFLAAPGPVEIPGPGIQLAPQQQPELIQ